MILKYIKNLLRRRKPVQQLDQTSICFILSDNGQDIDVEYSWSDSNNMMVAQQFGQMLFLINNGYLAQNIADMLTQSLEDEPEKTSFIQNVILTLASFSTNQNGDSEEPLIKPSEVFKPKTMMGENE